MLNPMCCITPRIGVFVFGIINLIMSVPLAWNQIKLLVDNKFDYHLLLDCILYLFLVLLALLLLFGAIQKSAENIRMWLMLWCIFIIIWIIINVFDISTSSRAVDWHRGSSLGITLLFLYEVWVAYAYLIELREGSGGLTYCPSQIV